MDSFFFCVCALFAAALNANDPGACTQCALKTSPCPDDGLLRRQAHTGAVDRR